MSSLRRPFGRRGMSWLRSLLALCLLAPLDALAQQVGDSIVNPASGAIEIVTQVFPGNTMVLTDQNNVIWVQSPSIGDSFPDPLDPAVTLTVTNVRINAGSGLVDQVEVEDQATPPNVRNIDMVQPAGPTGGTGGAPGNPGGNLPVPIPAGNSNVVADRQIGPDGAGGDNGWGIEICIIECWIIGEDAEAGAPGGTGPAITRTISGPAITSVSDDLSGIEVASLGGNGGRGGNAVVALGMSGGPGGAAGAGGNVTATSSVSITTSGENSHGIFVQSRAGNGGLGGDAYVLGSGGGGGPAAQGGNATATNNDVITTLGAGAIGLQVQSLGGGGGAGGDSYGIVGGAGSASQGGHGGEARANNHGQITTWGISADPTDPGGGAHGIAAQSIGGTGGNAGDAGGVVAIGGTGSTGGNGGLVAVTNGVNGSIVTNGIESYGILAQSVGGGGGNGSTAGGVVGIGGTGSGGGSGGVVTVDHSGALTTLGDGSHGILAESIGGGGGTGGTGGGVVGIGGGGSVSGNGGSVTVTNYSGSYIGTAGTGAVGVHAQSIGGGGGSGGGSGGVVAIGADGSAAGNGGNVTVTSAATIVATGIDARGILAQSIGGGGGSAHGSHGAVGLGGSGASGGTGGTVVVTQNGLVDTSAIGGTAILAQSIGGGGGAGGGSIGIVGLGGSGTSSGAAGTVTVTNNGSLSTAGDRAHGILAESIGGGGGAGGEGDGGQGSGLVGIGGSGTSSGAGSTVTVTNTGSISTQGNQSSAIEASSIGGGGGSGGFSGGAFVTIGGRGNSGGAGGAVTVNIERSLTTEGHDSHGVFATSIGGGGGHGGNSQSLSAFAGVAIGGRGVLGGNGAAVTVNSSDQVVMADGVPLSVRPFVHTEGERSVGIFAQSVGGGGGSGGSAAQSSIGYYVGASVTVGGGAGGGGNGGAVYVNGDATIITESKYSDGILAQSVGGGGGHGGASVAFAGAVGDVGSASFGVGVGGSGGAGGTGGTVTLNNGGSIVTHGDSADGLIAQSIGGGGGSGGIAVALGAALAGGVAGSVSVGVGGSGGDGGAAGLVTANYTGDVTTTGHDASGILVQAVGGGGGEGGFNVSGAVAGGGSGSIGVSVGVGGRGGLGGLGGLVVADVTGTVHTEGERAGGLIVQSVGGGGGEGGFNIAGNISASGSTSGGVSVGVGGAGGDAGAGNTARATFHGTVTTDKKDSNAVLVQSAGGGGGNGGFNIAGGISASAANAGSVSVGVGGAGGGGGAGGIVVADVYGTLTTSGLRSSAFVAQSMGGGGGNGGFNIAGAVGLTGGVAAGVSVGVGGAGGGGGLAEQVDASFTGTATTYGEQAIGVVAQSVGGGGGTGGMNIAGSLAGSGSGSGAVGVGVGGRGGGGGAGGETILDVIGNVTTDGNKSIGVIAQSAGGGGGNGGMNIAGGIALAATGTGAVGVGVGGAGGGGGNGGHVDLDVNGDVTTNGTEAMGIIAQSTGGGGGNGGMNIAGDLSAASTGAGSLGVGVGGMGGDGGAGGAVDALVTGNTRVIGDRAHAVLVQSTGGGGGTGGMNITGGVTGAKDGTGALAVGVGGFGGGGGNGGAVNGTVSGLTTTQGTEAIGVLIQSVGGGGGAGGANIAGGLTLANSGTGSVGGGVGGFGGDGGNGAATTAMVYGTVQTRGDRSVGVLAQSVGGGGGVGGLNITGGVGLSSGFGAGGALGIGGFGGGGGDSGLVRLTRTGTTETFETNSHGVVAQSVGGGGGQGGMNISGGVSASTQSGAYSSGLGLGGFGGDGGNSDWIIANVYGDVFARGVGEVQYVVEDGLTRRVLDSGSHGVLAQSIGGSGGEGGFNIAGGVSLAPPSAGGSAAFNVGVGGFGGLGGHGSVVLLNVNNDRVVASGDDRFGVAAQSIGGGGGSGGMNITGGIVTEGQLTAGVGGFGRAGGISNTVIATADTDIEVVGDRTVGFLAQSIGGGGGHGGINISGGLQGNTSSTLPSVVGGLGGYGGAGNISGAVTATQRGSVTTDGVNSTGVLVQSVAGGGGNGGMNISGNIALGTYYNAGAGMGGRGGAGADAGAVTLHSNGVVSVDGREHGNPAVAMTEAERTALDLRERATGILVQSIGGGGGNGGWNFSGAAVPFGSSVAGGVGGTGSGGGHAGVVTVNRGLSNEALLSTRGNNGAALVAQSIGGGGGNAGMNFTFEASGPSSGSQQAFFVLGGAGGSPGHGNTVEVNQMGDIETHGASSEGILAQSVGGGGGNAAFTLGAGLTKGANGINLAIGGAPGDGGNGNTVTVDHDGAITTHGSNSDAIFAQSIGGGGGNAAMTTAVALLGDGSLDIGWGRYGGTGGIGGTVEVTSRGTIHTSLEGSAGIRAQSVGNGGGKSGARSGGLTVPGGTTDASTSTKVALAFGLEGGTGGRGGNVDVEAHDFITTEGDEAYGIHAQSIGGGGGVGGSATSFLIRKTQSGTLGFGGTGGTGGSSGIVVVDNFATLETQGKDAHGIYAQSIGGGGGTGGYAGVIEAALGGGSAAKNYTGSLTVGGTGGSGATGNHVDVENSGAIITSGEGAFGINAQSIGGGGGDGGLVLTGSVSTSDSVGTMGWNIGGLGGDGGTGGRVDVVNQGTIHTSKKDADGIRAQSIGGGGGNAGLIADVSINLGGSTYSGDFNIGRRGGTGGASGEVVVVNRDSASAIDILTEGDNAHGVFAQSVGGGGGNGSSIVSVNFGFGKNTMLGGLSIGGRGGSGGVGGNASVTNDGLIETRGALSHGIFAQSIGGGGGNGGFALATNFVPSPESDLIQPTFAIGGSGGAGDAAGAVTVTNNGSIYTTGDGSNGILAQSIGGGGGNGNVGFALTSNLASNVVGGLASLLIGHRGGVGAAGGDVTVHQNGDIVVSGARALAVVTESINGGGGGLSFDLSAIFGPPEGEPVDEPYQPVVRFQGGGAELQSSNAARVTVELAGNLAAIGDHGAGSSVQAIGGGGGRAHLDLDLQQTASAPADRVLVDGRLGGTGGSDNHGGAIDTQLDGDVFTSGVNTPGIVSQSIGGGGGRANIALQAQAASGAINFILGGESGSDASGGAIAQQHAGAITTVGATSHGTLLQNIGGGGGVVSVVADSAQGTPAGASKSASGTLAPHLAPSLTLGSQGGAAMHGGEVELARSGNVITQGDNAVGLVLQSIGGGGGLANVIGNDQLAVLLGGSSGASGHGGSIQLANTGTVQTQGARAHGVFLQSIGGGGGAVFTNASAPAAELSSGNSGDGGAIDFTQVGDILTLGDHSYGLFVQSLGGGGGYVDGGIAASAGGAGRGGAITLEIDGDIAAVGAGSSALLAQSSASGGGDDILVSLAAERAIIGGAGGVAVDIDGGAANRFENLGMVATLDQVAGLAVRGGSGSDVLFNQGILVGDVDLGAGSNGLHNAAGGEFYSGARLNLGSGNLFLNEGTLNPGDTGLAIETRLTGSVRQTADAHAIFELDFATGIVDSVLATGAAEVAGPVNMTLLNTQRIMPGVHSRPIYFAAQGLTDTGLILDAQRSVVIDYAITHPDGNTAALSWDVDFAAEGLLGNRVRIGDYMNRVQLAGGSAGTASTVTAAVLQTDLDDYANLLTQLGTEFYAEQQAQGLAGVQRFARHLQDCGVSNIGRGNVDSGCYWLRFDDLPSERESKLGFPAAEMNGYSISQGLQVARDAGWTWGVGFDFEVRNAAGFDGAWKSENTTLQVGGQARRAFGNSTAGATLTFGNSSQQVERRIDVTQESSAEGERDVLYLTGVFDVDHEFHFGGFTAAPAVSLGVSALSSGHVTELGAGAQGAELFSGDETHIWIEPALGLRHATESASGSQFNAYARVGYLYYLSGTSTVVRAGFEGAPAGVDPMQLQSSLDRGNLVLEAGFELVLARGFTLGASYAEQQSDLREGSSMSLRFAVPIH